MPPAAITEWYYAAAAGGTFPRLPTRTAEALLRWQGPARPRLSAAMLDDHGGVTLLGVVLVLQMGRPVYVERCVRSAHASGGPHRRRDPAVAAAAHVGTWLDFAVVLAEETGASDTAGDGVAGLAAFLAATRDRVLPADVQQLLHETREVLRNDWLAVLRAGRQSAPLWDLRAMRLHPACTPLALSAGAAAWAPTRKGQVGTYTGPY